MNSNEGRTFMNTIGQEIIANVAHLLNAHTEQMMQNMEQIMDEKLDGMAQHIISEVTEFVEQTEERVIGGMEDSIEQTVEDKMEEVRDEIISDLTEVSNDNEQSIIAYLEDKIGEKVEEMRDEVVAKIENRPVGGRGHH